MNELLINLDKETALVALQNQSNLKAILDQIRTIATEEVFDVSTSAGKKGCASMAAKVAKCKTFIDGVGKDAVSGMKEQCKIIDAERKTARDTLDELKAEVRKPLTEFEDAEKDRIAAHEIILQVIKDSCLGIHGTIKDVQDTIHRIEEINTAQLEEFEPEAVLAKSSSLATLKHQLQALQERAAKDAELEELKKKQVESEAKERERNAADQARIKAEAVSAERVRQAELNERQAEIKAQAAEEARLDAIANAEAQAELAAQNERQKIAAGIAQEQQAARMRETDVSHKRSVNNAALACMLTIEGLSEEMAKEVLVQIIKGKINHIKINY